MKIEALKCPVCGGQLNMEINDSKTIFCPYCGNQITVGNNETIITKNINVHTRHTDDARIIEAQLKDKDSERKRKDGIMIVIGCIVLFFIFIGILFMMDYYQNNKDAIPYAEGKIKVGVSSSDMEGKKYEAIKETLETTGFTNITLIDLDDAGVILNKADTIDHVSIDGDDDFQSSDYFNPDAKIIISYH